MIALRRVPRRLRVTLVPLIDVLFILLAYFMVTSVYLDLDMIPMSSADRGSETQTSAAGNAGQVVMFRITADGGYSFRGRPVSLVEAEAELGRMLAETPGLEVIILPSPRANVQALAAALDSLSRAGVTRTRVMRLQEAP